MCCSRVLITHVLTPMTNPTTRAMAARSRSVTQIDRLLVISVFLRPSLSSHPLRRWVCSLASTSKLRGNDICRSVIVFWSTSICVTAVMEFCKHYGGRRRQIVVCSPAFDTASSSSLRCRARSAWPAQFTCLPSGLHPPTGRTSRRQLFRKQQFPKRKVDTASRSGAVCHWSWKLRSSSGDCTVTR